LSSDALRSGALVLDAVAAILEASGRQQLRVLELGAHLATLGAPSGKLIRIYRAPESPDDLRELVERVVEHNPSSGSELVIVGGGARHSAAIETSVPELLMHPFVVFHRTDGGRVECFPAGKGRRSL